MSLISTFPLAIDTYGASSMPTTSYGGIPAFQLGYSIGATNRPYLAVDISSLGSKARIIAAKLQVYVLTGGATAAPAVMHEGDHYMPTDLVEAEASWKDRKAATGFGSAGGDYVTHALDPTSIIPTSIGYWTTAGLGRLCTRALLNRGGLLAIIWKRVTEDATSSNAIIASRTAGVAAQRPVLTVKYEPAAMAYRGPAAMVSMYRPDKNRPDSNRPGGA